MNKQDRLAVSIDDHLISMAWVEHGRHLAYLEKYPVTQFSTLTDALLAYERSTRTPLLGATCALAVQGVTYGETIVLSRGSWAISREGLRSLFGNDVIVINNVAAYAWAVAGGTGPKLEGISSLAGGAPDFNKGGRWVLINVNEGVGIAVIDTDKRGDIRVLECEMGHCGFVASTKEDSALARAIKAKGHKRISWEMVLTLAPDDPVWSAPGLPTTRSQRVAMLAQLIGSYASDAVLAYGAWTGAIVTGKHISTMMAESAQPSFNAGFESKPKFGRLIRSTPRWRLGGQDLLLAGCGIALDRHLPRNETGLAQEMPVETIRRIAC